MDENVNSVFLVFWLLLLPSDLCLHLCFALRREEIQEAIWSLRSQSGGLQPSLSSIHVHYLTIGNFT